MKIAAIKTDTIPLDGPTLTEIIDRYVPAMPAGSILAISSKLVSICEGSAVAQDSISKHELIRQEADYYRAPESNPYHYSLTIKSGVLNIAAGVDYAAKHFIPWPVDPQGTANQLRHHLTRRFHHPVGAIITDSRSTPLRRGSLGFGLAYSGFAALSRYHDQLDVFGDRINVNVKVSNQLDGLAAGAVATMGEGGEHTPLALIEDVPFVRFQDQNPTPAELSEIRVDIAQDVFAEMLLAIPWDKHPPAQ
jgi:F420-0:gamma-glutamyl ligase